MPNLVATTVAAVAAALALSVAGPPPEDSPAPPAEPQQPTILAQRTVVCNNDLGDAALMNAATAASVKGDEIVFDGPCLVNQTIRLRGDRAYRGESRTGTVIRQADGANLDGVFASDTYLDNTTYTGLPVALRALTVDGNAANNPTAGDSIVLRAWQSVLEDVKVVDSTRHGIRVTTRSANGTVLTNSEVNGRISANIISNSGGSGLFVEDPANALTDWQILNNDIDGTGARGIQMDNAAGWMINENHISGVRGDIAISANRLYGTTITDNQIDSFGTVGIRAQVQGGVASTIAFNRIAKNNGGSGTFLAVSGNYGDAKIVVNANAINGNGAGIGLDYQVGRAVSLEVVSTGNLVSDVTTPRQVGPGVILSSGQLRAADAGL